MNLYKNVELFLILILIVRIHFPMIMILILNLYGQIQVRLIKIITDLFADGNDFSWEAIEKNRNIYYQKEMVRNKDNII